MRSGLRGRLRDLKSTLVKTIRIKAAKGGKQMLSPACSATRPGQRPERFKSEGNPMSASLSRAARRRPNPKCQNFAVVMTGARATPDCSLRLSFKSRIALLASFPNLALSCLLLQQTFPMAGSWALQLALQIAESRTSGESAGRSKSSVLMGQLPCAESNIGFHSLNGR